MSGTKYNISVNKIIKLSDNNPEKSEKNDKKSMTMAIIERTIGNNNVGDIRSHIVSSFLMLILMRFMRSNS